MSEDLPRRLRKRGVGIHREGGQLLHRFPAAIIARMHVQAGRPQVAVPEERPHGLHVSASPQQAGPAVVPLEWGVIARRLRRRDEGLDLPSRGRSWQLLGEPRALDALHRVPADGALPLLEREQGAQGVESTVHGGRGQARE
jgi:hypothetical protein